MNYSYLLIFLCSFQLVQGLGDPGASPPLSPLRLRHREIAEAALAAAELECDDVHEGSEPEDDESPIAAEDDDYASRPMCVRVGCGIVYTASLLYGLSMWYCMHVSDCT